MPSNVWLGSDRYSATASALNSAEYAFIAISDISSSGSSRPSVHDVLTQGGSPGRRYRRPFRPPVPLALIGV
ncbi:MAG: hypothetical protein EOP28_04540 [Rhodococcus sp. (in: high G+C Gram-positive bacteria)]|nr:MAG: hypothetical protein EOP28_04540 [Rhodococcus sp. (in: high G+C Gram-positive bacteria)]